MIQPKANGNVWKYVVSVLAGVVITFVPLWMSFASQLAERPTRKETSDIVAKQSPYTEDRKMVLDRLGRIEKKLDELLAEGRRL